jgi:hypothetical protein
MYALEAFLGVLQKALGILTERWIFFPSKRLEMQTGDLSTPWVVKFIKHPPLPGTGKEQKGKKRKTHPKSSKAKKHYKPLTNLLIFQKELRRSERWENQYFS